MLNPIPDFENGIKIESVGSFLEEVKNINKNREGDSTDLYFRGQETEFWSIEPSIFREDMLSIEHKLMSSPLQKVPMEFRNMQDTFEIMTKYQHYGMCTRLLDLTTNPLVALYFACKEHGKVKYQGEENEEFKEPYGVIYFKTTYPILSDDSKVKIITMLAKRDSEKENTIEEILNYLVSEGIISKEKRKMWSSEEKVTEFIDIIQCNHLVMPMYSNERLTKQSGAFLLPGLFTVMVSESIEKSIIIKSKKDLKDEFDISFFYIDGEDKESILKELDLYNINESTLFPELEHQLEYIKQSNRRLTRPVDRFVKYQKLQERKIHEVVELQNLEIEEQYNLKIAEYVRKVINDVNVQDSILKILHDNMVIDWYKRENIQSKMRITVASEMTNKMTDKDKAKEIADDIVSYLVNEYFEVSKISK